MRGLVRDRANLAFGASIVHRDMQTAKPCCGLVDQSADVILLADVGVDELGLRTERAQLLDERLAGLLTPTRDDHLRALLGKGDGGGAPDAGQGAGDQDNLSAHSTILFGPPETRKAFPWSKGICSILFAEGAGREMAHSNGALNGRTPGIGDIRARRRYRLVFGGGSASKYR